MRSLFLSKNEIDITQYRNRSAQESDCDILISEDATIVVEGKTVVVYYAGIKDEVLDGMESALKRITYSESTRTSGLVTTSRIFGFAPRNKMRNHPCRSVSLASEDPASHSDVCRCAELAAKYYRRSFPEVAKLHEELLRSRVNDRYVISRSMFTSGIINKNNPLQYHFDSGNFKNVCSAMFAFKRTVEGGHLCIPQLGVKLEIGNHSLLLFDGQGLLHGVTPIIKKNPQSYRYTVVYYSLQQMWNCLAVDGEIALLRQQKTEFERRKAGV